MDIKTLKEKVENKTVSDYPLIFLCSDNYFIAEQYINKISEDKKIDIEIVDNVDQLIDKKTPNLFGEIYDEKIKIFKVDNLKELDERFLYSKNCYILTKKISNELKEMFENIIVNFPKLEEWQIKDYLYSILEGADTKCIDWLIDNTNKDIYRLQRESEKLLNFQPLERNIVFKQMFEDDAFSDISSKTIFNFTQAIMNKDMRMLTTIFSEMENIDIEPIGLVTVLYKNFKETIQVMLNKNATAESLGMNQKKFNAIKYYNNKYGAESLIRAFEIITEMDEKIKRGLLPTNILIDYLTLKILNT